MKKIRKNILCIFILILVFLFPSCYQVEENPFWGDGKEEFNVRTIFEGERFPNVVVAMDGSVIATWGNKSYKVRRSEDGGKTWGPVITVFDPGFHGGGVTVDEGTGDLLAFVEEGHPIAPLHVYRSKDHGKTWQSQETTFLPNSQGHIPSMHMNETGITLNKGNFVGRLIRPTRWYGGGNEREFWDEHYTNSVYSDDGGFTWQASEPFPIKGTGEAAIVELADGRLYYNSRRHKSTDGQSPLWRYSGYSFDGGHTWKDVVLSDVLPDGNQNTDYGLMGGLVRLPLEGHDILLFSNIDVPKEEMEGKAEIRTFNRIRGTVWASFDGGKTWPVERLVEPGNFSYSSMAVGRKGTLSEGKIYLFYESADGGRMVSFNLPWLTKGRDWRQFLQK